jgi:RNA polymerase sigma factor (sigma-70 family)
VTDTAEGVALPQDAAVDLPTAEMAAIAGVAATTETAWVPPSWDEVVRTHADRTYRLAYRLSGNRADAEDLTQETFVRVFRSLADYTPGTFEGWLHRITTNLFLDMVRRRQRIRFEALSDEAAERLPAGRVGEPEHAFAQNNLDPEIEQALAALPPDFRAAVVLCDVEGLTYEEIAEILDAKLGTVRSRIHRGRAMLRTALAHRAPSAGRARYSGPAGDPAAAWSAS